MLCASTPDFCLMRRRRLSAQATLATDEVTQWRAAEIQARSLAEYVSILAGGALFSFGHIAGVRRYLPAINLLHLLPAACSIKVTYPISRHGVQPHLRTLLL